MSPARLLFDQLILDKGVWPRLGWHPERVELFTGLFLAGEELPPIEVVLRPDGKYLIADGAHRAMAARSAKRPDIKAIVLDPSDGGDLLGFAYRRALETATRSALPLSKEERKRAVLRLKAECPDLSHRAIAKLVGVSHDTVDRWTRTEDESEEQSRPSTAFETPAQAARRFANDLGRLYESRGILDMLIPKRMGQALAIALADQLGSGARARAETFAQWTAIAVQVLAAEDR